MHSGCRENDWGLKELVEFGERVDWEDVVHIWCILYKGVWDIYIELLV